MALHLIRSNKVEFLFDSLSSQLGSKHLSPFESEWLVTQNPGMTKWLSLQLSDTFGVWANDQIYFPKRLLERSFYLMFGNKGKSAGKWNRESMALGLYEIFAQDSQKPDLGPVSAYLNKQTAPSVRLELAQKIADCFDQYLVYRPDWIKQFELDGPPLVNSPHWDWQKKLWNRLSAILPTGHWADLTEQFIRQVDNGQRPEGYPERISIFGLSTLPPSFIQLLKSISQITELYLYTLNPTEDFWADLQSPKMWIKESLNAEQQNIDFEDQYHQQGNSLLSFLGRMGQEFQALITEQFTELDENDQFDWPEPTTLLSHLQAKLAEVTPDEQGQVDLSLESSIQVFRAHSPLREIEQTKNQILLALNEDRTLDPKDFLVLVSDLEAYLPLVSGVFDKAPRVPFSLADRSPTELSPLLTRLLDLLKQPNQRWELSYLMDWLRLDVIQSNFGLTTDSTEWVAELFTKAGVRWGLDGDQKEKLGQPNELQNTWAFGIKRVLLGYAMSVDGVVDQVNPLVEVEGNDYEQLDGFFRFFEAFEQITRSMNGEKKLADWVLLLNQIYQQLFLSQDETDDEAMAFQTLISRLSGYTEHDIKLDCAGLSKFLNQLLDIDEANQGFLNQGVTFSAMKPMRTVPFAQVMMLGISESKFPARVQPISFDLTTELPRLGDRSKKEDDKYLFLEALLAARDRLTISYVGLSSFDQSTSPPSVVVAELLEFLDQHYRVNGQKCSQSICFDLPLLPFAEEGFDPSSPQLANFDPVDFSSAQITPTLSGQPVLLPTEGVQGRQTPLPKFKAFFKDPLGAFFRQGLGLEFRDFSLEAQDREPQVSGPLDRYQIQSDTIGFLQSGVPKDDIYKLLRGRGVLPYTEVGSRAFEQSYGLVKGPYASWLELTGGEPNRQIKQGEFQSNFGGVHGEVQTSPRVDWIGSTLNGKQLLPHWVDHLFANQVCGECESYLIGSPKIKGWFVRFRPVKNPKAILAPLIDLFQTGLARPLPLFPDQAYLFVQSGKLGGLKGGWNRSLEYGDFAELLNHAFGSDQILFDPDFFELQSEFAELAELVFRPMIEAMEVLR